MGNMNFENTSSAGITKEQGIGLVGTALMAGGLFLPFVTILAFSVNFIDADDGKIVLAMAIFSATMFFFKWFTFAGLGGLVALATTVYDVSNVMDAGNAIANPSLGIGAFVICLGALVVLYASGIGINLKKRERSNFS